MDILERLRYWGNSFSLGVEAADEIEKLRAERDAMKAEIELLQQENARLENEIIIMVAGEDY